MCKINVKSCEKKSQVEIFYVKRVKCIVCFFFFKDSQTKWG